MTEFNADQRGAQEKWRLASLENNQPGIQNKKAYLHVLPRDEWELGLWPPISGTGTDSVSSYLARNLIHPHTGKHNLCSSWVLCANLYFPFRNDFGRELLAAFLREVVNVSVTAVTAVELEYEPTDEALKPGALLGEDGGGRGTGQTSPDVAFEVETPDGTGLILVESKYTEHWFYECSGHRKKARGREPNPDPSRCEDFAKVVASPEQQCHLLKWNRRYWEYMRPNPAILPEDAACPAATGAYQLFRQQAYAEALAAAGPWSLVVSAVAYDERNEQLFKVIGNGRKKYDARRVWGALFPSRAPFRTFTHQSWVAWVRQSATVQYFDWLEYVHARYDY